MVPLPAAKDIEQSTRKPSKTNDRNQPDNELGLTRVDVDENSVVSARSFTNLVQRSLLFAVLIFMLGCSASAAFLVVGIRGIKKEQDDSFVDHSAQVVEAVERTFEKYKVAGLFVHEACRNGATRKGFRELYEYLIATGLKFQVTSFNPNVTASERETLEADSEQFYSELYPELNYSGIQGLEPNSDGDGLSIRDRSDQPFYFPVHFLEPIEGNEGAIDFDLYSSGSRRLTIHRILETWEPALTPRLSLVQESVPGSFGVILMHPGTQLSTIPDQIPRDFSSMVVRIPDLIAAATEKLDSPSRLFIYDATISDAEPEFLGGATIILTNENSPVASYEPEIAYTSLINSIDNRVMITEIDIAAREWTIVVIAVDGTFQAQKTFIILGGAIIVTACAFLALWLYANGRRHVKLNQMQSVAEAEKAKLILDNLSKTAKAERELNEYIAHEVRNPLAAALSACNFATSEVANETEPLTGNKRDSVLEDLRIVDSSLHFINDLLRNMLDLQRASSREVKMVLAPTDIKKDVLLTVDSLLYRRGGSYQVIVDCPDNLIVDTDSLRLKQVILNLAHNAEKFVATGFIRIRACMENKSVHLYVEDSGPGIPQEKKGRLFAKFQESLDQLNQGTGVGLSLCKRLTELLGGEIWHDESYDSGVDGCPGTRFVVNLKKPPCALADPVDQRTSPSTDHQETTYQLPDSQSVLFVDDDLVLRKLFTRAVKKCAPNWTVHDVSSGESALQLIEQGREFNMIFVDQYMAGVGKQLLGTETVRLLRSKGVTSFVCGLSANDMENSFSEAGANGFLMKPFPANPTQLGKTLSAMLQGEKTKSPPVSPKKQVSFVRESAAL